MRLRFSPGNYDPIGHGQESYTISNGAAGLGPFEVEVPDRVGNVLLASGAGAVRVDAPPVEEAMHPVRMRHPEASTLYWRGQFFEPELDGTTYIPAAAVTDALSHGFTLAENSQTNMLPAPVPPGIAYRCDVPPVAPAGGGVLALTKGKTT